MVYCGIASRGKLIGGNLPICESVSDEELLSYHSYEAEAANCQKANAGESSTSPI
jgi:hypothetical protein